MMIKMSWLILVVCFTGGPFDGSPHAQHLAQQLEMYPAAGEALELMVWQESSNGKQMIGDRGKANGWLGQHSDAWREGRQQQGVDWEYPRDTQDLTKCKIVAIGYWLRHARAYMDDRDELIRRHRLPYAPYRKSNDVYLKMVLRRQTKF